MIRRRRHDEKSKTDVGFFWNGNDYDAQPECRFLCGAVAAAAAAAVTDDWTDRSGVDGAVAVQLAAFSGTGQAHRSYRPVAFSAAADRKAGGYGRAALFPGGHPLHPYRQSPDRRAVHPKEPTVQLGNRNHRHRLAGHFAGALGK